MAAGHSAEPELAARVPKRAWQRLSAGKGAKGHRYYDWAWAAISDTGPGCRWLLIRRHPQTNDLGFYRCYPSQPVTLATLVNTAGRRWTIEENIQASKGLAGLDEHQVRTWTSWHRWVTLAMLALAFVTIAVAAERALTPNPDGQIPLTRNEIARLFTSLITKPVGAGHQLGWSAWRRHHQCRAQICHYQRQSTQSP